MTLDFLFLEMELQFQFSLSERKQLLRQNYLSFCFINGPKGSLISVKRKGTPTNKAVPSFRNNVFLAPVPYNRMTHFAARSQLCTSVSTWHMVSSSAGEGSGHLIKW